MGNRWQPMILLVLGKLLWNYKKSPEALHRNASGDFSDSSQIVVCILHFYMNPYISRTHINTTHRNKRQSSGIITQLEKECAQMGSQELLQVQAFFDAI